jgi:hypothetical protein
VIISYVKGVGWGLVVVGVIIGTDCAGMSDAVGAAAGIATMVLGVALIRISKAKA